MDSLEKIFGKTAQLTVLKNLIEHQNDLTYLSRIAKETGLSQSIVLGYQTLSHVRNCHRKTSGQANSNFPYEPRKQSCKFDN